MNRYILVEQDVGLEPSERFAIYDTRAGKYASDFGTRESAMAALDKLAPALALSAANVKATETGDG